MTMGDWIQGSETVILAHSYRPWTGTCSVLHYLYTFLEARPSLPWDVGGCRDAMVGSTLPSDDRFDARSEA